MNIWSGSREGNGLAAALTNPTELSFRRGTIRSHYPVLFDGLEWPDAEAAYQAYKINDDGSNRVLMAGIIAAKLGQHRRLLQAIHARGGEGWLKTCSHFTGAKTARFQRWEGEGEQSAFIRCLILGYLIATKREARDQTSPSC